MASEFKFPSAVGSEELELASGDNQSYVVENKTETKYMTEDALCSFIDDVSERLNARAQSLASHENFDALYSVAVSFNELKDKPKARFIELIVNTSNGLLHATREFAKLASNSVADAKADAKSEDGENASILGDEIQQKSALRNSVKMAVYLLSLVATAAEKTEKTNSAVKKKAPRGAAAAAKPKAGGKSAAGKKAVGSSKGGFDWLGRDKERVCTALLAVLENESVRKLWRMAAPGQDFGAVFFQLSALMLESPDNMKNKSIRDLIFRMYIVSAKEYSLYERSPPALLHVLMNFEHSPQHIADMLRFGVIEFDLTQLVTDMAREIGRMGGKVLARDSAGAKNLSTFLPELGSRLPKLTLANLSVLMVHLDNADSYMMRNGIVQLLGQLVEKAFDPEKTEEHAKAQRQKERESGKSAPAASAKPKRKAAAKKKKGGSDDDDDEDDDGGDADFEEKKAVAVAADAAVSVGPKMELTKTMRQQRDTLYQLLVDRVLDSSSYTRSKVVQTWTELANSRTIPLSRLPDVVRLAVGRLEDKTAIVRKNAINLMHTLLAMNPYGPELDSDQFKAKLQIAGAQFKEMFGEQAKQLEAQTQAAEAARDKAERKAEREAKRIAKANAIANGEAEADDADADADLDESVAEMSDGDDGGDGEQPGAAKPDEKEDLKAAAAAEADQQSKLASLVASGEYARRKRELEYYFDAIRFIEPFESSVSVVSQLMSSKNSTDVLECIKLLVTENEFKIAQSHTGVRKMLTHIWSKEAPIKDAVMAAYQRIYIGDIADMERQSTTYQQKFALSIAKNLICLTHGASLSDVVCLEELLVQLMRQNQIPSLVVQALWDIFAAKQNDDLTQKNGALLLLGMIAGADPAIVTEHISTIVTVGLVKRSTVAPAAVAAKPVVDADSKSAPAAAAPATPSVSPLVVARENRDKLRLARTACIALQKIKSPSALEPRMLATIFTRLACIIREDWGTDKLWYGACEQAISTIFALHPHPELLSTELLKSMIGTVFSPAPSGSADSVAVSVGNGLNAHCESSALSKLFFICGHTAVKMLVHLEAIETRIKKVRGSGNSKAKSPAAAAAAPAPAAAAAEPKKKAAPKKKKKKAADSEDEHDAGEEDEDDAEEDAGGDDDHSEDEKAPKSKPAPKSKKAAAAAAAPVAESKVAPSGEPKQSAIEEELAVNASEEYELEQLRERAERDLIERERGNLLSVFGPVVARVCAYPLQYAEPVLQSSAVLALCKFMTVSADFCDDHLRLLFTILQTAKDPKIRANIIISLGDMCFRFPNLLEPWSAHMYGRLRDADIGVRKNALMVLSHLILNDMLKAKGPVAEIAKCIRDSEPKIADLARLFFSELSKKGKDPIYNMLPDILSRLSRDANMTTDDFNAIMKFLLAFIEKDKQTESLLDRLCRRFDDQFHLKAEGADSLEFPMRKQASKPNAAPTPVAAAATPAPAAGADASLVITPVESAATAAAAAATAMDSLIAAAASNGAASAKPKTAAQQKEDEAAFQMQHWRDIAYCMSQLNCNEKCVRTLATSFKSFQRALADETVYTYFVDITTKAKKFSSASMKDAIDELEKKLAESHKKQAEDEVASNKASLVLARNKKKAASASGAAGGKGGKRTRAKRAGDKSGPVIAEVEPEAEADAEGEADADADSEVEVESESKRKPAKKTAASSKSKKVAAKPKSKVKAKPAAKRGGKAKAAESENDENDDPNDDDDDDGDDGSDAGDGDDAAEDAKPKRAAPKAKKQPASKAKAKAVAAPKRGRKKVVESKADSDAEVDELSV